MDLLLRNLTLVDGRGGDPVADAVIAIAGGRIVHAGRASDGPRGAAEVIDAGGHVAVPGLINAHVHLALDESDLRVPRLYMRDGEQLGILQAASRAHRALVNGVTTLRDCNAPGKGLLALRQAFGERLLPGPRLVCCGCAICATGGHMHAISIQADTPEEVAAGVQSQVEAGADFIKLVADGTSTAGPGGAQLPGLSVAALKAGVDAAHASGRRASAHAVSREGVRASLAAGADCIEHGYDLPEDLIAAMRAQGTRLVPTLSVHGAIVRHGPARGWPADRVKRSEEMLATALSSVGRAAKAGIPVACGSDAGSPFNAAWELVPELSLLCEAGLTPAGALACATVRAAEALALDQDIGTLEAGKCADVVLVEGDPLRDIGALGRVRMVIRGGEVVRRPS